MMSNELAGMPERHPHDGRNRPSHRNTGDLSSERNADRGPERGPANQPPAAHEPATHESASLFEGGHPEGSPSSPTSEPRTGGRRRGRRGGRGRSRRTHEGAEPENPHAFDPARHAPEDSSRRGVAAEEDHDAPPIAHGVDSDTDAAPPVRVPPPAPPGHGRRRHAEPARAPRRAPEPELEREPEPEEAEPEVAVETRFAEFPIPRRLVQGIAALGYIEPTEVQKRMIPLALEGKNVVARSRTGTGKTAAFLIPALAALEECQDGVPDTGPRGPVRMLAVVPTRELAIQVAKEAEKIARFLPVTVACVYGGTRMPTQVRALQTASIVVGTPGRLLDHLGRHTMDLQRIHTVVLDEVDRMYDLGFRDDVDKLLRYASARKQTLLMSATLNEDVERLVAKHLPNHERFEIASASLTVDEVQQTFYIVDRERKQDLLMAVCAQRRPTRCIVFVRTKFNADRVAWRLQQNGFGAQEIHSGLEQRQRERILVDFREGKFPLMIATDVASRGLDIQGVDHVINMDIPENPEDYVHRVGRTARMGKEGWAITFVTPDDGDFLTTIEKLINKEIKQEVFPGFEARRREVKPPPPAISATSSASAPGAPGAAEPESAKPASAGIPQWNRPSRRRR
jgi:ATP-dependent RNA helicase DeaD